MINLTFFGSSQHSVDILLKLTSLSGFKINLVVTKEDKPVGRDLVVTPNPVAKFAKDTRLPLLQISEFTPDIKLKIKNSKSDIGLCVAFGPPFFDADMIALFPYGIVNIHPSPLPRYRGATPGPWQIINGETKSAVSFFLIDEKPDHGPIIAQIPFLILPQDTSFTFYNTAFELASHYLEEIITSYIKDPQSMLQPQDHSQRTYFPKFDKNSAQIDWSWDAAKIERFIRAMIPWPVAWTFVVDQKVTELKMKIFSAKLTNNQLIPHEVQLENKTRTFWSQIDKYYRIKK